jgi:pimeloyl-ACP methyl ester carboxylesterase
MVTAESPGDVLLVHGVGSSFEHNWVQLGWVDLLADTGRGALAFDLPGHGSRTAEPDLDAAELIIAAAEQHGPLDAVGFSAGAFALLRAAVARPELFQRIALMGIGDASLAPQTAEDGAGKLSERLLALSSGAASSAEASGPELVISRLIETAGNEPGAVAAFLANRRPNPSMAELARVSAKTLVVEGSEDFGGSAAQLTEAIAGARRVVLKGVDHFAIPSDFRALDAVLGFLAE